MGKREQSFSHMEPRPLLCGLKSWAGMGRGVGKSREGSETWNHQQEGG